MRFREGTSLPLLIGGLASVTTGIVAMLLMLNGVVSVPPLVILVLCVGGSLVATAGEPPRNY